YQLPAGMFGVEFSPISGGEGSLFRVEIGAGFDSPLRMGALKFLTRGQKPNMWQIMDQQSERLITKTYGDNISPDKPLVVPAGRYTILVQLTSSAEATALVKDLEVKPSSIVEVQ